MLLTFRNFNCNTRSSRTSVCDSCVEMQQNKKIIEIYLMWNSGDDFILRFEQKKKTQFFKNGSQYNVTT